MQSALDKEGKGDESEKRISNEDDIAMDVDGKETERGSDEGLEDSTKNTEEDGMAGDRINKDEAATTLSELDKEAGNALAVFSTVLENLQLRYSNLQVDQYVTTFIAMLYGSADIGANQYFANPESMLTRLPPFYLMPLYFFRNMMYSKLFKNLSERALSSSIPSIKFHNAQLATKHQFHLCFLEQEKPESATKKRGVPFSKERKKVLDLLDASFNYTTKEDKAAIINAYNHGGFVHNWLWH